jgi:hypothetical protein
LSPRIWLPLAVLLVLLGTTDARPATTPAVAVDVPRTVTGTTTITVTSPRTPLTHIEILIDRVVVATCPGSPCSHQWDTTGVRNGNHRVVGRVFGTLRSWKGRASVKVANPAGGGSGGGSQPPAPGQGPPPGNDPLAILLGPLLPIGSPELIVARYDEGLVDLGQRYAAAFPAWPGDLISSNYYDLALVLYTAHQRTQDPAWREQARRVARTWRDAPENRAIPAYLAGNWALGSAVPPPRGMATIGLAILALEAGDDAARDLVHLHARLIEQRWVNSPGDYGLGNPVMPMGDQREAAYGLIALVASTLLGEDHAPAARRLLDAVLARQRSSGQWEGWVEGGHVFTNNFMNGLLMEALALYDRALGDARITPAIERAMAWTWNTQWVPGTLSFKYDAAGSDPTPAPVLNGLFLPGWAHAYARTGRAEYRDQAEAILRGLVENGLDEIWGVKQFGQVYRSSGQYLGCTR